MTIRATTTIPPSNRVRPSSAPDCVSAPDPIAPSRKTIGTRAISSNSSIESAALPTGVRVPVMRSTSAVDERANARPSASAVAGGLPSA
jgi:hypothetical protein